MTTAWRREPTGGSSRKTFRLKPSISLPTKIFLLQVFHFSCVHFLFLSLLCIFLSTGTQFYSSAEEHWNKTTSGAEQQ